MTTVRALAFLWVTLLGLLAVLIGQASEDYGLFGRVVWYRYDDVPAHARLAHVLAMVVVYLIVGAAYLLGRWTARVDA